MSQTWIARLRSLPLRSKVFVTVVVGVAAVVGASTWFSFRYWQREIGAAGEQQVLLAANSARATLESTLPAGRDRSARHALDQLLAGTSLEGARVHGADGRVLLSADRSEEGRRPRAVWLPAPRELPRAGLVRTDPSGDLVRAWLPLSVPEPAVLEVELSVAPLRSALQQGARLGVGLVVVSVLALGVTLLAMLEREVVAPLERVEGALAASRGDGTGRPRGEVRSLEGSVRRLLARERAMEERAAEREGFAEVGELAAEMAHELKRPLASIRTAVDLLEQEYALEGTGRDVLAAVNLQLERLTDTMTDLFSLARPVAVDRRRVPLPDVLDGALLEARRLPAGGRIEVRRRYGGDAPAVRGDAHRLSQAFANVLSNASEAMPEGGLLTVETRALAGGEVEVAITDTGTGIPAAEVERVLRPFYSTKPLGTGLGLPLVARVVAAHGGRLALESAPGRGTTVRIVLPGDVPGPEEEEEERWGANGSWSSTTTI